MGHQKKLASPLATCIISEHISREYLIWPQRKSTVVHITPPMGVTCSWARVCMTYYACSIEEPQNCIVPHSARVSMATMLVEELQNCIVPRSARTWWLSCYITAIATLGQDLMLVLLKKYKTALCHTRPGSDAVPVEELQNRIVPRLARIWWWSCWRTTKLHLPRSARIWWWFCWRTVKLHCATLSQDLMEVLLMNRKTALCHTWPGSAWYHAAPTDPQNHIMSKLSAVCRVITSRFWMITDYNPSHHHRARCR